MQRAPETMPPALGATILLGKALVVVGLVMGAVLFFLPLTGPRSPRLALALIFSLWGWLAWQRAEAGHEDAPIILAAGITATGWTYYVAAPFFGVQVTGVTLLLPILACLSILGPVGVGIVGLGGVVLDMVMRSVMPPELSTAPIQSFSLLLATALGWVVARLHRRYVLEVATAHAEARESALRQGLLEEQARFLRGFINSASHEIATPLTPMVITLRSGATPSPEGLQRLRRNLERLQHIADGLGHIAAFEARAPDPLQPMHLRPVVTRAMDAAKVQWPIIGDGDVMANEDLIQDLVQELADNQQRHAPASEVRVMLGDESLQVIQTPAQLPPGLELGLPFQRQHDTSQGGLGLYSLVRRMDRIGGQLHVEVDGESLLHIFWFPKIEAS